MIAAVVQLTSTSDLEANLARAGDLVELAAGRGAELVALPENFALMREEGARGENPHAQELPGGFGTLDELFECLTLKQTGKSRDTPIILVGTEFWSGMIQWLESTVVKQGLISQKDLRLFSLVDSAADVCRLVREGWAQRRADLPPAGS